MFMKHTVIGLQINNTIFKTAGIMELGVSRGSAEPVVVAKSAGKHGGYYLVHVMQVYPNFN